MFDKYHKISNGSSWPAGIGEVNQLRVILREQVCQDAQDGRGGTLIEAEPNEYRSHPQNRNSSSSKTRKVMKYGTERPTTALAIAPYATMAVGGEGGNQDLNNDVHDGVVGIHQGFHHAGTARGLSLIQRVLDTRDAVAADDRDKVLRAAVVIERKDVVETHEGIGEGDTHEEAEEAPCGSPGSRVEASEIPAPKPDEHDGRESDAHANPEKRRLWATLWRSVRGVLCVIQFSTPIHPLSRVDRQSIGQGLCATVVGRRNMCLIRARNIPMESRL